MRKQWLVLFLFLQAKDQEFETVVSQGKINSIYGKAKYANIDHRIHRNA